MLGTIIDYDLFASMDTLSDVIDA